MWIEISNGARGLLMKRIPDELADMFMQKHTQLSDEDRALFLAASKAGDWVATDGGGDGAGLAIKMGAELGRKTS